MQIIFHLKYLKILQLKKAWVELMYSPVMWKKFDQYNSTVNIGYPNLTNLEIWKKFVL